MRKKLNRIRKEWYKPRRNEGDEERKWLSLFFSSSSSSLRGLRICPNTVCFDLEFFAFTTLLFFLFASATTSPILAQSNIKGAIRGTVHEEKNSSAGVPNATVTILNLQTGYTTSTITSGRGSYSFEFITPGNYKISAEATGYEQIANSVIPLFDVNFNMVSVVSP